MKEYREVLSLAKGVVASALRETADGFQVKDLIPIVSDNLKNVMSAYENAGLIPSEWKADPEACMVLTVDFAVDVAMDILKVPAGTSGEFKETNELIAAVSGITASVISHLPGGISGAEIVPIVFENFNNIIVGVDGADKIKAELSGNVRDFVKLVSLAAIKIAFEVKAAMEAKV